jgi:hypothetical protein
MADEHMLFGFGRRLPLERATVPGNQVQDTRDLGFPVLSYLGCFYYCFSAYYASNIAIMELLLFCYSGWAEHSKQKT